MSEDMLKLINEKRGIVEANVTTALEMTDKEKNSIALKLKQYSGKNSQICCR
jgi:F0F1-type ATP synthase delta subunit